MIIKKGNKWLQREFMEQLEKQLAVNHTINISQMVNFVGRERLVENMISRGEIEEAGCSDLQIQENVEREKKKTATEKSNLKTKLEKEEAALAAAMGI